VMEPRSKYDRLVFTGRLVEAGLTLVESTATVRSRPGGRRSIRHIRAICCGLPRRDCAVGECRGCISRVHVARSPPAEHARLGHGLQHLRLLSRSGAALLVLLVLP
jgi:hypothetical protein